MEKHEANAVNNFILWHVVSMAKFTPVFEGSLIDTLFLTLGWNLTSEALRLRTWNVL